MHMPEDARRNRWTPGVMGVCILVALYLLAASIAAVVMGNLEFIFYIVVMVVLIGAALAVHVNVCLPTALLLALALWGLLHMAGGLVPVPESWPIDGPHRVLYSWWMVSVPGPDGEPVHVLKFDHVVHAYGFAVATWLCWVALVHAVRKRTGQALRPTVGLMVLIVAAGCGLGAMNEIVEFAATRFAETNVGGYENTGWDLVANAAGAIVAAGIVYVSERRRTS